MKNLFGHALVCTVIGSLVPSISAQPQVFLGSLLGDNGNSNNANIPLLGSIGLGTNNGQQDNLNNNYNQFNNNNQYNNNNNANRGLLSVLGVNGNVNRPNINNQNNLNRYPNTPQNNPSKDDLKTQLKETEELLERIKELNRVKEQQKLENKKGIIQEQPTKANNRGEAQTNKNVNMNSDGGKSGVLKSLTKKKFYFMVKPVVPENEAANYEQTLYYVD